MQPLQAHVASHNVCKVDWMLGQTLHGGNLIPCWNAGAMAEANVHGGLVRAGLAEALVGPKDVINLQ